MIAFQKAIADLNERVEAVVGAEPGADHAELVGNPERMIRSMLSGFMPVDETDYAMEFLNVASRNVTELARTGNSPVATHAGVRFSIAQLLVIGCAVERQNTLALRDLERAARRYFNEFDHLIGDTQYVERQAMREALAAVKR